VAANVALNKNTILKILHGITAPMQGLKKHGKLEYNYITFVLIHP
jgi:hypothetical protein